MRKKFDVIVIGNIPPPIGGVSMHVSRLIENLNRTDIEYAFYNLRKTPLLKTIFSVFKGRLIHLHTSNAYFTFFFSIWCYILKKKLIMTYHGNLNRYGHFKNLLDHASIRIISIPIVINKLSFDVASKLNANTRLLPAFMPPLKVDELNEIIVAQIDALKANYKYVFSTNAFNVSYDKHGREIYQITDLVKLFNTLDDTAIIISDPSSAYYQHFKSIGLELKENILILPFVHDFNAVINKTDCLIRFTTTDGDSLSIKEALFAGKSVIATNVVDRPKGVILVDNNIESLNQAIGFYEPNNKTRFNENGFDGICDTYKVALNSTN